MATSFINEHGVPSAIANAITNNDFSVQGDISVSQLLDSPQIRSLRRNNDVEVDVMSMIWLLMHNALHEAIAAGDLGSHEAHTLLKAASILMDGDEKAASAGKWILGHVKKNYDLNDNFLRAYTAAAEVNGYKIYGTVDRYDKKEKKIQMFKVCSVYQYIYPENKKKWLGEINVLAYLLRSEGHEVESAEIIALFKDYSASGNNKDYPEHPMMTIPIPILADDETQKLIAKKVKVHQLAEEGTVPICTAKERWNSADTWAVTMAGAARASKVLPSEAQAEVWNLDKKDGKGIISLRPGEDRRCEKYCAVSQFCPQYMKRLQFLSEEAGK